MNLFDNDTTDQTYDYLPHWWNVQPQRRNVEPSHQGSCVELLPGDLVNMADSSPIF